MHIVAIIQARMASSRLPGKVLQNINGRPMLAWVVERAQQARQLTELVVATTTEEDDDVVAQWCAERRVSYYRGAALDVLDRYYQTACAFKADVVVRLTADCPFLDPALVDAVVARFVAAFPRLDFATNRLPPPWGRSFPIGLDVEVMTMIALGRAWREARKPHQREHVTPYFYETAPPEALCFTPQGPRWREATTPRGFRVALYHAGQNWGQLRWTVDTPQDLAFAQALAGNMGEVALDWQAIRRWLEAHPEVRALNETVRHKTHQDIDARLQ
ncbi:acylneuraminate cytidylyltransferase [Candidatus Parcubacteria bacterium]|nr:MAG: acylneuraminate cytidylyltransferase [Candidatus Parcubacteria bacterium]